MKKSQGLTWGMCWFPDQENVFSWPKIAAQMRLMRRCVITVEFTLTGRMQLSTLQVNNMPQRLQHVTVAPLAYYLTRWSTLMRNNALVVKKTVNIVFTFVLSSVSESLVSSSLCVGVIAIDPRFIWFGRFQKVYVVWWDDHTLHTSIPNGTEKVRYNLVWLHYRVEGHSLLSSFTLHILVPIKYQQSRSFLIRLSKIELLCENSFMKCFAIY